MPKFIEQPSVIPPPGKNPKLIEEYAGRVATHSDVLSLARIVCPAGWSEVGQQPKFTETKVVLKGMLRVEHTHGVLDIRAGQAVICEAGEWVRYSTPESDGAEYVTVCVPAFSPATVHRDSQ
ncbi:cupin domain-containing protein [Nitrospira sp. M1]